MQKSYQKLLPLQSKRENLSRKHKRAKTHANREIIEQEIIEISKAISPIKEEIKYCEEILNNTREFEKIEKMKDIDNTQEKRKDYKFFWWYYK